VSRDQAGNTGQLEDLSETASQTREPAVYRYRGEDRTVLAFFSGREGPWRWREWSSDAAFLAVETDASGREGRRVFLAGGSFIESTRGRIVSCSRYVECWEWLRGGDGEQVYCSEPEAVEQVAAAEFLFPMDGAKASLGRLRVSGRGASRGPARAPE
jgi:hypothetical protein